MTCAVNVSTEAIRTHARAVDGVAAGVAEAMAAANYLAHADDGYGPLVQIYAAVTLNDLHDEITSTLSRLNTLTGEMPGKLTTAADTFDQCDTTRAGDIAGKTAEIERNV